jgi:hypothetical protein
MDSRRICDRALIGVFLGALFISGALAVARSPGELLPAEYRRPAPPPKFSRHLGPMRRFPAACEAFFCDRLPWRERLLTSRADCEVNGFGVSSSDKVILGRDGWLFLDEGKEEGVGQLRDAVEQCRQWLSAFRRRQAWCAARGIDYVLLPTPEKQAIYPEFLPAAWQHPHQLSAAERLMSQLRAGGDLCYVDLEGALRTAKSGGQVYFRTDTHWNERGGLISYRACGPALGFQPMSEDALASVPRTLLGDLNRMLCLSHPAGEPFEQITVRAPRSRRRSTEPVQDPSVADNVERVWETGDKRLRRAVIFHDSYAKVAMLQALAEHFETLAAVPTLSFDEEVIARFQPDVVVQQFALRRINGMAPPEAAKPKD